MADAEAVLERAEAAENVRERLVDPLNLLGAHGVQSTSRAPAGAMRLHCNFRRLAMTGRAWTGRDATALRAALRLTTESFARRLAVAPRTVAGWAEKPGAVPRAAVQRALDDAYAAAPAQARARFAELASPEGPTAPQFFRVAMAVVTRGPDVLLVRRRADNSGIVYGWPAGTVKPGEEPAAVAVRETLAETGVSCAVRAHLGGRVHPVTGVHCDYFACSYEAGEALNRDEAENEGVLWAPVREVTDWIPRGAIFPPVMAALEASMSEGKPAIASAVVVRDGRLLLARRREREGSVLWVLPGGAIEAGETAEGAAVREALEETCLTVAAREVLGSRVHPATHREMHYVACDVIAGDARVGDPEEHDAVEWVPIADLPQFVPLGFFPAVQERLDAELAAR